MIKPFPSPDLTDHVRRDTRIAIHALTPGGILKVQPYCAHDNQPWPCPTVSLAQQRDDRPPAA